MRKYRLVAKKGEGTFSEVIKAQNIKSGTFHAIKCMKSTYKSADQVRSRDQLLETFQIHLFLCFDMSMPTR